MLTHEEVMKGYYVYLTQDGITHLRWFRAEDSATEHWRNLFGQTGIEASIRGEMTYNPVPVAQ